MERVKVLVEEGGADVDNEKPGLGGSALNLARGEAHEMVVEYLSKKGGKQKAAEQANSQR